MARHRPVEVALPLLRRSLSAAYTRGGAAGAPEVCADVAPSGDAARGSPAAREDHSPVVSPRLGAKWISQLGGGECSAGDWVSPCLGSRRRSLYLHRGPALTHFPQRGNMQQALEGGQGTFALGAPRSADSHGERGDARGGVQCERQFGVLGTAHLQSGARLAANGTSVFWHWAQASGISPYTHPPISASTGTSRGALPCVGTMGSSPSMGLRGMGSAASGEFLASIREQIKPTRENPPPLATSFDGKQRRDNRQEVGYQVVRRGAPTANPLGDASAGEEGEGEGAEGAAAPGAGVGALTPVQAVKKAVFAVVQVGSHQFKVTPGDVIYTEKLLFADLNDTVHLDRVLLLGSRHETVIGRPTIPGAHAVALVEEQAQDAKVIVFKKKRRKNYRRHQGHRQELTRLFILDVHGIEETPGGEMGAGESGAEGLSAAVSAQ